MDRKISPTVVISKKDIIDEKTVKSLMKSSDNSDENTSDRFDNRNLMTSTPVAGRHSLKTRISLKNFTSKSSTNEGKRMRHNNIFDDDDDDGKQTINKSAMEVSLNLSQSLAESSCAELEMDGCLASLIKQEMLNPSGLYEYQSTSDGRSRKKSRKNPTPKRKKNNGKANQDGVNDGGGGGGDDDVDSGDADTIRNIKTPICLPKKRRIDDGDKTFDDTDSVTPASNRRTSRSAAVRARQKVRRIELDDEPTQEDDEYADDEVSKIDDEDEYDDVSFEEDDYDSMLNIKRECSRVSVSRDASTLKKKKWMDVVDKDLVLKLKQKQQQLNLLADWLPRKEFYTQITLEEGKKHLPVNQRVKFRVQRKATAPPPEQSIELDLFEHHVTEDAFTIKIGGPLWAMDWCPTPMGESCNQYLALYTHQSPAQTFTTTIQPSFQHKCLIQIWDFGKLSNRMSTNPPALMPLLVVDGGPIWQMKWSPGASTWIGGDDDDDDIHNVDDDTYKSRLGLLACACHSGNVKIFSIPRFPKNKNTTESNHTSPKISPENLTFLESFPCSTLKMSGSTDIPCISVDWNVNEKHVIVAAGFADGAVALWNLSSQSTLLSSKKVDGDSSQSGRVLFPFKTFRAHLSVVSGLHFCQTTDNLLLTCSHDKYMKVWNIHESSRCILSHRTYKITSSMWPANERSRFYVGFDEAYILQRNSVACFNFYESKIVHISHCLHNGTITSISHKEWSNIVTSCDNTGCVQSCLSIPEKIKGIFTQRRLISMIQVEDDVEGQSLSSSSGCECKNFYNPPKEDVGSFPISCCCNKSYIIKDFNKNWPFKNSIKSQTELPFDDIIKNAYSALHRVCWNLNKESCDWIAFGGLNGLLRIRIIPDFLNQKK